MRTTNSENKTSQRSLKETDAENENLLQLVIITLNDQEYAITIQQVKEVTYTPEISKLPKSPSYIEGITNIRGNILAIMNLEKRLGLKTQKRVPELLEKSFTVVVDHEDYNLGFVVFKVPESISIPESAIEQAPDFFKDAKIDQDFIRGICKVGKRLIILLDLHNILTKKDLQQLQQSI